MAIFESIGHPPLVHHCVHGFLLVKHVAYCLSLQSLNIHLYAGVFKFDFGDDSRIVVLD